MIKERGKKWGTEIKLHSKMLYETFTCHIHDTIPMSAKWPCGESKCTDLLCCQANVTILVPSFYFPSISCHTTIVFSYKIAKEQYKSVFLLLFTGKQVKLH